MDATAMRHAIHRDCPLGTVRGGSPNFSVYAPSIGLSYRISHLGFAGGAFDALTAHTGGHPAPASKTDTQVAERCLCTVRPSPDPGSPHSCFLGAENLDSVESGCHVIQSMDPNSNTHSWSIPRCFYGASTLNGLHASHPMEEFLGRMLAPCSARAK
ncbi:hypothetical protein B0H11DRAFT_1201531 [Mycena galericulata]|nr:hypothetical protein B0H11DRAFT_1201531 [Mycena galericulata]